MNQYHLYVVLHLNVNTMFWVNLSDFRNDALEDRCLFSRDLVNRGGFQGNENGKQHTLSLRDIVPKESSPAEQTANVFGSRTGDPLLEGYGVSHVTDVFGRGCPTPIHHQQLSSEIF